MISNYYILTNFKLAMFLDLDCLIDEHHIIPIFITYVRFYKLYQKKSRTFSQPSVKA